MNDLVTQSKWFAIGAHGQQKRKYTEEPYWVHLEEVNMILKKYTNPSQEMLATGWLHDVVEDTEFSIFDINEFFGSALAKYVDYLTEPALQAGNRMQRKAFYHEVLASSPPDVQTIKYADLISNTSSIIQRDPQFAKLYLQEKRDLLTVMNKGDPVLYKMACELSESYTDDT